MIFVWLWICLLIRIKLDVLFVEKMLVIGRLFVMICREWFINNWVNLYVVFFLLRRIVFFFLINLVVV